MDMRMINFLVCPVCDNSGPPCLLSAVQFTFGWFSKAEQLCSIMQDLNKLSVYKSSCGSIIQIVKVRV
jgi:hypothetical protein